MRPTILTRVVAQLVYVPAFVVALAMLVKGYAEVGDGFAAGVVVALAVLLQALAMGHDEVTHALRLHHATRLAIAGLGIAVTVALVPLAFGRTILQHAPGPGEEVATVGTLELITAVAFDLGIFLLVVGAVVALIETQASLQEETGTEEDAV